MTMILVTFAGLAVGYLVGMYHRLLEEDYEWWEEHNKHLHDCYLDLGSDNDDVRLGDVSGAVRWHAGY